MSQTRSAGGESAGLQGGLTWFKSSKLLLVATALRLALALALFGVACQAAPEQPYTWLSHLLKGPDAITYQADARQIYEHWRGGQESFDPLLSQKYLSYPSILAAVYWLSTPHPLAGVLLNVLCFLVAGLMARRLAYVLGQRPAVANGLALLVTLWPPSLAYGSILLKDSLVIMAIFVFLGFSVEAILSGKREGSGGGQATLRVLAAGLGAFFLMCLREEFQPVCLALGLLAFLLGMLAALRRPRRRGLFASLALALALLGAFYLSNHFSFARLVPAVTSHLELKQNGLARPLASAKNRVRAPDQGPALVAAASPLAGLSASASWLEPHQALIALRLRLTKMRWEYACTGGVSLDPSAQLIPFGGGPRAQMAWRGLDNLLLFPYPWQGWPLTQSFTWRDLMVSLQSVLWYLMLPGLALGLILSFKQSPLAAAVILAWFVMVGAVLTFVDLNLGTLYRHRDMVILPLLPFICTGLYAWLWRRRSPGGAREPGRLGGD